MLTGTLASRNNSVNTPHKTTKILKNFKKIQKLREIRIGKKEISIVTLTLWTHTHQAWAQILNWIWTKVL